MKEFIRKIEELDFEVEGHRMEFMKILNSHRILGGIFECQISPHPDLFYTRARAHKNLHDYFCTVDDFSYNKDADKVSMGRANLPKQQIFYAGRVRVTALAEVNIINNRPNDKTVAYAISRWVVKKPFKIAAILNPSTIHKLNCREIEDFVEFVTKTYLDFKGTEREYLIEFYEYLSSKFSEVVLPGEEHKYFFTSAIANQIYRNLPDVSGLLYQSVKDPTSYNLALKKDFIDKNYLEPDVIVKCTFERVGQYELAEINKTEFAKKISLKENIVSW